MFPLVPQKNRDDVPDVVDLSAHVQKEKKKKKKEEKITRDK